MFTLPTDRPVAFDWDDTLVHTRLQFENATRRTFEEYGLIDCWRDFEEDLQYMVPQWTIDFFRKLEIKISIISNKGQKHLDKEIAQAGFGDKILHAIGDANKPNSDDAFRKVSKGKGVMFGDNMNNDLVGAMRVGWDYQFLNIGFIRDDANVLIRYT